MATSLQQRIKDADAAITTHSVAAAQALLEAGKAVFVDVREHPELASGGTIPGAIHIPRGLIEFCTDPASPLYEPALMDARPLVLFCASGGRSALAGKALLDLGALTVGHLAGGFGAWCEANGPTEALAQ